MSDPTQFPEHASSGEVVLMREAEHGVCSLRRHDPIPQHSEPVNASSVQPGGQAISQPTKAGFKLRGSVEDGSPSLGISGARWEKTWPVNVGVGFVLSPFEYWYCPTS